MYRKKAWIAPFLIGISLLTGLAVWSEPAPATAQRPVQYKPPKRGIPKRREGAGTRGGCLAKGRELMPLIPTDTYGVTVSEQPTFFWYIPPKSIEAPPEAAKNASFRLLDEQDQEISSYNIPLSGYSGIVSFTLPTSVNLEADREYTWQFSVVCDENNPSANPYVEGVIQRVQPSASLSGQISRSRPQDRPAIYASAGIWYDSLTSLANLRCGSPSDIPTLMNWTNLLSSVNLNDFAGEPLSQYCTQISNGQSDSSRADVNRTDSVPKVLPNN